MIIDIISNFTAIINQAVKTNKNIIFVPYTSVTLNLCSLFYKEGLIYLYQINYREKTIKICMNQLDNNFIFRKIHRISKPSKRIYWTISQLKNKVMKEGRYYILSTNVGLITSNQALIKNISGEIWMEICF
jgi:ribosomal protein S8